MSSVRTFALGCLLLLGACKQAEEVAPEPARKAVAKKEGVKTKTKAPEAAEHAQADSGEAEKFVVPFAWEAAKDEPLAQTRSFLKDAFADNLVYMEHGDKFFAEFADKQTPRATVVTCADSRVHAQAWDTSPENDDFMIRNIGNQVANAEGSVEYGVEHLQTPLLLIVGHTGCGAVKAAMGDLTKLDKPIQKELELLHVPKPASGKTPEGAWAEAVIANVNNQVEFSLKTFGRRVQEGKLTVVGAVYDFRNDLLQGAGRLVIVNVNGNSEPARMTAFVDAINNSASRPLDVKDAKDKKGKSKRDPAEPYASAEDIAAQISRLPGFSNRVSGAPLGKTKEEHPSAEVTAFGHHEAHEGASHH